MQIEHEIIKKLKAGKAKTANNIRITYKPEGAGARLAMMKAGSKLPESVYCDAMAARELADFYTNLAEILEG